MWRREEFSKHIATHNYPTVLVDGDIGKEEAAAKSIKAGVRHFATIDVLVNDGNLLHKAVHGFYDRRLQRIGLGQLVGIPVHHPARSEADVAAEVGERFDHHGALADNPIAGVNASVSMSTKGGLNTVTRQLAIG